MSVASVTDITPAEAKARVQAMIDRVTLALPLPESLYDRIKLDSTLSKIPVGTMIEGWIDQNVSLQNIDLGLATFMNQTSTREILEPGVKMKGLTVPLSKKHYGLLKMEALRQQTTIRSLLKRWILENTREWYVEPMDHEEQLDKAA